MEKIPTIFDRNWDTDRKVNPTVIVDFDFANAIATEKLDGTNVRVTIRSGTMVRLEKRRNPDKAQKKLGITEPWYVEANASDPADKYIFAAAANTDFAEVPDGEWSAEALGESIQGNPLGIKGHTLFLFSVKGWLQRITFAEVPTTFDELKDWLTFAESKFSPGNSIEGIVWHNLHTGEMCKIKAKDFR